MASVTSDDDGGLLPPGAYLCRIMLDADVGEQTVHRIINLAYRVDGNSVPSFRHPPASALVLRGAIAVALLATASADGAGPTPRLNWSKKCCPWSPCASGY